MKPQLHQVLAVEPDLQKKATMILEETLKVFKSENHLFNGSVKVYNPLSEDEKAASTADLRTETPCNTTAVRRLDYTAESLIPYWNAVLQKERTNQTAKADLVVDGKTLMTDVPATFLLGMEAKLKSLREVLVKIPTHDLSVTWIPDTDMGEGFFKTKDFIVTNRTKKERKSKIIVPATDKQPAQVDQWTEDVKIGEYHETRRTGTMTPLNKSQILGRIDKLIVAVKEARQVANCADLLIDKTTEPLVNFILKGE